jgi:hypothetical protein
MHVSAASAAAERLVPRQLITQAFGQASALIVAGPTAAGTARGSSAFGKHRTKSLQACSACADVRGCFFMAACAGCGSNCFANSAAMQRSRHRRFGRAKDDDPGLVAQTATIGSSHNAQCYADTLTSSSGKLETSGRERKHTSDEIAAQRRMDISQQQAGSVYNTRATKHVIDARCT